MCTAGPCFSLHGGQDLSCSAAAAARSPAPGRTFVTQAQRSAASYAEGRTCPQAQQQQDSAAGSTGYAVSDVPAAQQPGAGPVKHSPSPLTNQSKHGLLAERPRQSPGQAGQAISQHPIPCPACQGPWPGPLSQHPVFLAGLPGGLCRPRANFCSWWVSPCLWDPAWSSQGQQWPWPPRTMPADIAWGPQLAARAYKHVPAVTGAAFSTQAA